MDIRGCHQLDLEHRGIHGAAVLYRARTRFAKFFNLPELMAMFKEAADKMYGMGIHSLSAYIRKMALDGYCLNLDLPQLRRMAYLLQNCSNNLNQVAKRANENGKIYSADLADLRTRLDELISIGKQILTKLANL